MPRPEGKINQMNESLASSLATLSTGIESLARSYSALRDERARLINEVASLRRRVSELESELKRAHTEIEYLTVSHRLADTPDALLRTRRTVARMIRRLDDAVKLLEADPAL